MEPRLTHALCQTDADLEAWDDFVARVPGANYQQLWGWLSSYEPMGMTCEVMRQSANDRIVGGAAFVSVPMPFGGGRVFVLPHGPIFAEPSRQSWSAFMAALDEHFRRQRAIYVQAWPHVPREDVAGLAPFVDAGYDQPPLFKSHTFTSTLLAVDLAGRTEEDILAGVRSETRQHYRRGGRRGLELRLGRTHDDLRRSHALLEEAGRERGLPARPYQSLARAFDRLIVKDRGLLVQAWKGSDLTGTLVILFAGRIATCFASAIHREYSWFYPMEFMHVSAMLLARERGMDVYDLMNWTTGGIAEFKRGFRPRPTMWTEPRTRVYRPQLARLLSWGEDRLRPLIRRWVRWRTNRTMGSLAMAAGPLGTSCA
jgi:lipid II:glycine glycyltransferase (peptidoglycan interpeptide bridge formation enzyme)